MGVEWVSTFLWGKNKPSRLELVCAGSLKLEIERRGTVQTSHSLACMYIPSFSFLSVIFFKSKPLTAFISTLCFLSLTLYHEEFQSQKSCKNCLYIEYLNTHNLDSLLHILLYLYYYIFYCIYCTHPLLFTHDLLYSAPSLPLSIYSSIL